MGFDIFSSGGFTIATVVNSPDLKLEMTSLCAVWTKQMLFQACLYGRCYIDRSTHLLKDLTGNLIKNSKKKLFLDYSIYLDLEKMEFVLW